MISELKDIPNTLVAFRITGEIKRAEFDAIVVPAVAELVRRADKINYLLITETPVTNLAFGAWLQESMAILNHFDKWNRAALVTDIAGDGEKFKSVPGEFRLFFSAQQAQAVIWAGEQDVNHPAQIFADEGEAVD